MKKESRIRSGVKTIIWYSTGFVLLSILTRGLFIPSVYFLLRVIGYFFYERWWNDVEWGLENE